MTHDELVAQRDHWKRLFNRLDAAITHHQNSTVATYRWDFDYALYAAHDKVLKDAARGEGR